MNLINRETFTATLYCGQKVFEDHVTATLSTFKDASSGRSYWIGRVTLHNSPDVLVSSKESVTIQSPDERRGEITVELYERIRSDAPDDAARDRWLVQFRVNREFLR